MCVVKDGVRFSVIRHHTLRKKMMITGSLIALFGLASHNLESRTPDRRRNSSVAATSRGGGRTAKRTTQNRKEGRKSEVDNLARRLGLHQPPKSKKRPKSSLVSTKVRLQYATKGHAALRGFLDESTVKMLYDECNRVSAIETLSAWQQKVDVQARRGKQNAHAVATKLGSVEECQDMLDSGADELPFLQFFNIWKRDDAPTVRRVCLSPHLAETASILLDCKRVRLYQDSLFHKRAGDLDTPWHSDNKMAPFDSSKTLTFWIPLQPVPANGSALLFVDSSHLDFALPYWNGVDGKEYDRLENRYDNAVSHHMPLRLGDVTVHNGWTLHSTDTAIETTEDRLALAITYVDARAEIREDVFLEGQMKGDVEDLWSYKSWIKDVPPRKQFVHPDVPVVWPPKG